MNLQQFALFFVIACAGLTATSAWTGPYYQCDPQVLEDDQLCVLIASDDCPEEFLPLSPHNTEIDGLMDFHSCVVDLKMNAALCLETLFKPWEQGCALVACDEERTGEDWMYALAFEIISPIRDKFMYDPWALLTDDDADENWALYTKVLEDCHFKEVTQMQQMDDDEWYLARNLPDFREALYPVDGDLSWEVVWFVEEIQHMLLCVMTDLGADEEVTSCREPLASNGIKAGEWSNCWVDAYVEMWGVDPPLSGELTNSIWVDGMTLIDSTPSFGITPTIDIELMTCVAVDNNMDYPSAEQINAGLMSDDEPAHMVATGSATAGETFTFIFVDENISEGYDYEIICATDDGYTTPKLDYVGGEEATLLAKKTTSKSATLKTQPKTAALKKRQHLRRKESDLSAKPGFAVASNATLIKSKKTAVNKVSKQSAKKLFSALKTKKLR